MTAGVTALQRETLQKAPYVQLSTTQPAEASLVTAFAIVPFTAAATAPFKVTVNSALFNAVYDQIIEFGWNADLATASVPVLRQAFEQNYNDGTHTWMEWYLEYWSADHTTVQNFRPIGFQVLRDANASHAANVTIDIGGGIGEGFLVAGATELMHWTAAGAFVIGASVGGTLTVNGNITSTATVAGLQVYAQGSDVATYGGVIGLSKTAGNGTPGTLSAGDNNQHCAVLINPAGGSVAVGAAVATGATTGFFHIPTCPGTPTGVPAAQTGTVPLVFDTTNRRLYVYESAAWHYMAEAA